MKNSKLKWKVVALLSALVLMGTISNAQNMRHYNGPMHDRPMRGDYGQGYQRHSPNPAMMDQLNLTDDQKSKIDEIKLASGKNSLQRQNKINELEAQLTSAITQDKVDKSKVNSLIDEIGKLRTENRKARMDDHLKIRELLTDNQRIIFDQRRSGRR